MVIHWSNLEGISNFGGCMFSSRTWWKPLLPWFPFKLFFFCLLLQYKRNILHRETNVRSWTVFCSNKNEVTAAIFVWQSTGAVSVPPYCQQNISWSGGSWRTVCTTYIDGNMFVFACCNLEAVGAYVKYIVVYCLIMGYYLRGIFTFAVLWRRST